MPTIPGADYITEGLYIGSARSVFHAPLLRARGITSVLKLYFDEPEWPDDFTVCKLPFPDGTFIAREHMVRGVSFISGQIEQGNSVLVACRYGVSRSSAFILAYLLARGTDLQQAWELLKHQHEDARPTPQLWAALLQHYDPPYTKQDVLAWSGWQRSDSVPSEE